MTKLILAGAAALALATGAACAATMPTADFGNNAPAQFAQLNHSRASMPQPQAGAAGYGVQNNAAQSGSYTVVSHPITNFLH